MANYALFADSGSGLVLLDVFLEMVVYQTQPALSVLSAVGVALVMLAFFRLLPLWAVALLGFVLIVIVFPMGLYLLAELVQEMGMTDFASSHPILKALFLYNTTLFPPVQYPIWGWPTLGLVGYVFGLLLVAHKITLSMKLGWLAVAGLGLVVYPAGSRWLR